MTMQKKPPVVTIMGHVDHGKTTLLDYIRKTKLAAKEFGEITQTIGAYRAEVNKQKITFIDTPGHEAFSQMRARGAKVADLVVLVVSATDGVMPQTKESIKTILKAKTPFIVAINKTDLPEASIDRVKAQLAEEGVLVEGYGGKVVAIPVSAKTGEGVDQLLEMIQLSAEMADLKADPEGDFQAEVIESKADKLCGSLVTLIIKNGTLRIGDRIQAGGITAKVKALRNELGEAALAAFPGEPVAVLGFTGLPPVGSLVAVSGKEEIAIPDKKEIALLPENGETEKKLTIILKADFLGSLEAVSGCLPDDVLVLAKSVGEINESDIMLAKTLKADVYGFNLTPSANVVKLAETERVKIKNYKIIYDLLKNIEERILKIMEPTIDRKVLGKAEILQVFEMRGEKIAGCRVVEGKINKAYLVLVQRVNQILVETKLVSLKQQKQDINEATVGMEFGAVLAKKVDFLPGDMLISYSLEND